MDIRLVKPRGPVLWWAGCAALAVSLTVIVRSADLDALGGTLAAARADGPGALLATAAYGLAFVVRAAAWTLVLPALPFGHALAALHVSLAGNHLLPLRMGEALRVTSVVRRARILLGPAAASTVVMRAADVVAVLALAAALGPRMAGDLLGPWAWALAAAAAGLWLAGIAWLKRTARRASTDVRPSSTAVVASATVAWVLESAVLYEAARWAGIPVSFGDAVLVTAVTIAAQVVALAPGGLGTYEAAATAAFVGLGARPGAALAAAVTAHALKSAYALVAGAVALFVPTPSALGALRLPRRVAGRASGPVPDGPVVLFLPAHDEEDAVSRVITRAPEAVAGRDVIVVVVDDGSSDATAARARAAGAEVVSLGRNMGLGAAVRTGLGQALERGAAAVAFCDADGEYAPEELGRIVEPILSGRADYVVGSRFAGDIRHMLPHRRVGNLLLTRGLSFVARARISDGQSGYRALSRDAARAVEIIHDFNYAQVLTLDLLAKGFRYEEVPISYSWRTGGRSFVRPARYLRAVIPAVHRELNSPSPRSVSDGGKSVSAM